MKWLVLLIAFSFSPDSFSQAVDSLNQLQFDFQFDSVRVSVWNIHFKESSLNSDIELPYPSQELARTKLSEDESSELLFHLKSNKSYDAERALQDHHDLIIEFYHSGDIVGRIELSMMTGNITAENLSNGSYFRNNCSKFLGTYIEDLLNEHGIIEALNYDEVDLMGLR